MARYAFRKSYSRTSARVKFGELVAAFVSNAELIRRLAQAPLHRRLLQPWYSHAAEASGDFRHLGLRQRFALLDRLLHRA